MNTDLRAEAMALMTENPCAEWCYDQEEENFEVYGLDGREQREIVGWDEDAQAAYTYTYYPECRYSGTTYMEWCSGRNYY